LLLAAGWYCTVARSAYCQEAVPVDVEKSPHPDGRQADVYLDDSFEAADAIAQARSLANRGRWSEAAEMLQRTSEQAGDKLVAVAPGYYLGIRDHVNSIIAGWPEAGIGAYRNLFEREISKALPSAWASRSLPELLSLFGRYFCTTAAADLADAIGQLAIESGDPALAEHAYRRVLDRHPDAPRYVVRYEAMLALIAAMRGSAVPGMDGPEGDVRVRWMGRDRAVREIVSELREGFPAARAQSSPTEWPIFGGNAERNRQCSPAVDVPGLLWRFDGFEPKDKDAESKTRGADVESSRDAVGSRQLSVYPVVSGDLVFVQRYRNIVALHRNTGAIAWGFRGDKTGTPAVSYFEELPSGWDSVTIDDEHLYASIPSESVPYYGYESPRSTAELVCLDAGTGRLIWRVERQVIEEEFAEIVFDSSPVVQHGRLYIVGRRRRSFGFEDSYLYRFNATTGVLEHRTHLGSASTGNFGARQPTKAIVALHGDTVYVCTDLGSIAAVSAYTGAVRWLRLYDRAPAGTVRGASDYTPDVKPWAFNPVIWYEGRVIFLPVDSAKLLIVAADDGRVLHSIPIEKLGGVESVLGIQGNILCCAGAEVLCYDLSTDAPRWSASLLEGMKLSGRGVWADDRLLVPTRRGLSSFRVLDGQRTDVAWDSENEGGNLLAMPDQLLFAGSDSIAAYVRKADIWKALRERIASAPTDPLPAIELAEVALSSREFDEALAALDEAVGRADRMLEPVETGLTRRLFDDVLALAERLAARSRIDAELLEKLCSHATRYAPDTAAHLNYRLKFADLFANLGRPDRAVRLYQQILRDRSLRELPVHPSARDWESGGTQAEARIAALILSHGRSIYAPHEAEAKQWMESAEAAGDVATLERLVGTFPNSETAPRALVLHGELLVRAGKAEEAAKQFSRAYHRYSKGVARVRLLKMIADAYEAAGKPEHAFRWLTKAACEYPSARLAHQDRMVTFLEYREHLSHVRDRVEPSRPSVTLPLNEPFVQGFEGDVSLLVPWFGSEPSAGSSHYFARTPDGIRAFDSKTGIELWSKPAAARGNVELLLATAKQAAFTTLYEVFALDLATGSRTWSYGQYPRHLDEPDADWEDQDTFVAHSVQGNRLVSVSDSGRIACMPIDTGEQLWSEVYKPKPLGRVRLSDPWVVYHAVQDEQTIICLVDAETGAWSGTIATDEKRSVEDIFVTLDGQIIVATAQSVSSYDPETRQKRWRVPLGGRLRRTSLWLDVDALYFSDDGVHVEKISVEDGQRLWESERLVPRADEGLTVDKVGGSVVVGATQSVSAVDAVTGLTLWRGTAPQHPRFVSCLITGSYVVAVDVAAQADEGGAVAYFYDHRNASGLIPRDGGAPKLGALTDVRAVMAADDVLLIQTGSTIKGWRHK
jgi:outer membrane protein assembly factor BamB